jgi:hypothetical protein
MMGSYIMLGTRTHFGSRPRRPSRHRGSCGVRWTASRQSASGGSASGASSTGTAGPPTRPTGHRALRAILLRRRSTRALRSRSGPPEQIGPSILHRALRSRSSSTMSTGSLHRSTGAPGLRLRLRLKSMAGHRYSGPTGGTPRRRPACPGGGTPRERKARPCSRSPPPWDHRRAPRGPKEDTRKHRKWGNSRRYATPLAGRFASRRPSRGRRGRGA